MKIEKAIGILEEKQKENEPHWERGDRDALKLGTEALKAVKDARANNYYTPIATMPGETID